MASLCLLVLSFAGVLVLEDGLKAAAAAAAIGAGSAALIALLVAVTLADSVRA